MWLDNPPPARMTLADWQTRLEKTFNREGVIGGTSLLPVLAAEREYGAKADALLRGFLVLSESFQNFLFDTIRLAEHTARGGNHPTTDEWFGVLLMEFASLFRAFRAADTLYHSGYPLDGFSLLRDVRDRAIFIGGIGSRLTTLRALFGYQEGAHVPEKLTEEMWAQMHRRAEAVERDLIRKTIGAESGLGTAAIDELKGWTELFHLEVHGSRLTRATEFRDWITGKFQLPLVPEPRTQALAVFVNRFVEVGWMILRVLPLLQLAPNTFESDWEKRWNILDDSFRHDAEGLWRMGKPIEGAIIHMIDVKFAFSPKDAYSRRCGGELAERG